LDEIITNLENVKNTGGTLLHWFGISPINY
jgi:hypothetical protein